jgi:hypothetical protein
MTQAGKSLNSKQTGAELEVLKQFLPDVKKETFETHATGNLLRRLRRLVYISRLVSQLLQ